MKIDPRPSPFAPALLSAEPPFPIFNLATRYKTAPGIQENFGISHDVIENNWSILDPLESPTISMKINGLSELPHDLFENTAS
jgi:hypothetical protein